MATQAEFDKAEVGDIVRHKDSSEAMVVMYKDGTGSLVLARVSTAMNPCEWDIVVSKSMEANFFGDQLSEVIRREQELIIANKALALNYEMIKKEYDRVSIDWSDLQKMLVEEQGRTKALTEQRDKVNSDMDIVRQENCTHYDANIKLREEIRRLKFELHNQQLDAHRQHAAHQATIKQADEAVLRQQLDEARAAHQVTIMQAKEERQKCIWLEAEIAELKKENGYLQTHLNSARESGYDR